MNTSRDFDGSHRIDDYPQRFSSEADAQAAIEFAEQYGNAKMLEHIAQELRYKAAANSGASKIAVYRRELISGEMKTARDGV